MRTKTSAEFYNFKMVNELAEQLAEEIADKLVKKFPEITYKKDMKSFDYHLEDTGKEFTFSVLDEIVFYYNDKELVTLEESSFCGQIGLKWYNKKTWRRTETQRTFDKVTMRKMVASGARFIKNNLEIAKENEKKEDKFRKVYLETKEVLEKHGFKAELDSHGYGVNFTGHGLTEEMTAYHPESQMDMKIPLDKLAKVLKALS